MVLFENLIEGRKKKFQVWNEEIICTSWGIKKEIHGRKVVKEVISLANKLENNSFSSFESVWRHLWNNFVALSLIYHVSVLTLECTMFNV